MKYGKSAKGSNKYVATANLRWIDMNIKRHAWNLIQLQAYWGFAIAQSSPHGECVFSIRKRVWYLLNAQCTPESWTLLDFNFHECTYFLLGCGPITWIHCNWTPFVSEINENSDFHSYFSIYYQFLNFRAGRNNSAKNEIDSSSSRRSHPFNRSQRIEFILCDDLCDRFIWCVPDCRLARRVNLLWILWNSVADVRDQCAIVYGSDIGALLDYRWKTGPKYNR